MESPTRSTVRGGSTLLCRQDGDTITDMITAAGKNCLMRDAMIFTTTDRAAPSILNCLPEKMVYCVRECRYIFPIINGKAAYL